jgi:hypothetical protein
MQREAVSKVKHLCLLIQRMDKQGRAAAMPALRNTLPL